LDFGLAKLNPKSADEVTVTADVTDGPAEIELTTPGVVMGTAAYMSPEQVRGEVLDARTDIFSFGVVLYEMATGQLAFQGASNGIVAEAILNRAPEPYDPHDAHLDFFRIADVSAIESLAFCPQSKQDVTATRKYAAGLGRVLTSRQVYNVAILG